MALSTEITRRLDDKYVQVDVKSKNLQTRYFKVPEQRAKSFAAEYKKQNRKMSIITNTTFAAGAFGGVLLTSMATKKIKGIFAKYILNTLGGVAGAMTTIYASTHYIENKEDRILKKYGAQEIYYEA